MTMTKAEQAKAAFFAEVASVADPHGLSPGQQLVLQERAEALFGFTPPIDTLLDYARKWLFSPLRGEGGKVDVPLIWRLHDGVPTLSLAITKPGEAFLADLWTLLLLRPFPFKQCPVCGRIFASQSKKKRYCSANCSSRGIEEARKEARRPQARERMRRLRAQEKALASAQARRRRGLPPAGNKAEETIHAALPVLPAETAPQRKARQEEEQQRLQQRKSHS